MAKFEHGKVVAAQPEAVEAGAATLRSGALVCGVLEGGTDPGADGAIQTV